MRKKCIKITLIILLSILFITIFMPKSFASITPSSINGGGVDIGNDIDKDFKDKTVKLLSNIRSICCSRCTYGNRH